MPQLVTAHPELVKKMLSELNQQIKCGQTGSIKRILCDCPDVDFCSLPNGEFCIYSVKNMQKASQIRKALRNNSGNYRCSMCGKQGHNKRRHHHSRQR